MALSIKRVFVSFVNDDGKVTEGYFDLLEQTINYIKIQTGNSILTIPYHRINKVKESS